MTSYFSYQRKRKRKKMRLPERWDLVVAEVLAMASVSVIIVCVIIYGII